MDDSPSAFPDWAHLPLDVVHLISAKVKSITDHVRFRAVCSPWRSASLPKPCHLQPQLPWLMIPYDWRQEPQDRDFGEKKVDGVRLFYDVWESKMRKLHLPETIGMMCCASYRGWLLIVATDGTKVFLLNPLTQARIQLPPFTAPVKRLGDDWDDPFYDDDFFCPSTDDLEISKVTFSADLADSNCLIMVFLEGYWGIFYCRVGDRCWINLECRLNSFVDFADAMYYNGKFYFLYEGAIEIIDLNKPKHWIVCDFEPELFNLRKYFLEGMVGVYVVDIHPFVEEEEETTQEDEDDLAAHFAKEGYGKGPKEKLVLYQFDEQQLKLTPVTDTSNTTIFYGGNFHYLAVCSDDWDLLDGGSMYMAYIDKSRYSIYSAKWDEGMFEHVVRDLGEVCLGNWLPARAMWFQPCFV